MEAPAVHIKNELHLLEEACRIVAQTFELLERYITPGRRTLELDQIAEDFIRSQDAEPAFKGYRVGNLVYPYTLCVSINDAVVHGMPGDAVLQEGDIVSIDCGCKKNGYYGDSAYTFAVGKISEEKARLLRVTHEALWKGIEQAVVRNKVYHISRAIQEHVERNGFSVVRELVGHGIGKKLHDEPPIPNFVPPLLHRSQFPNVKLRQGQALAIEPMVNAGKPDVVTDADGWTVRTVDHSPSAHFEHTVVVQDGYPLVLTQWKEESRN